MIQLLNSIFAMNKSQKFFFGIKNKKNEIILIIIFALLLAFLFYFTDGRSIKTADSIPFGFGQIIKSLQEEKQYIAKDILYPGGVYHDSYAHRMPLIPIWFSLFGDNLILASFMRGILFGLISIPALKMLKALIGNRLLSISLLSIISSPLVIRRLVDITSEESWLTIFLPCSFIGLCFLVKKSFSLKNEISFCLYYINILLSFSFLTKPSILYLAISTCFFCLIISIKNNFFSYKNTFIIISPLLTALILWNIHVFSNTGQLTTGTSWSGWALLKGNNSKFAEYFPKKGLDLLDYEGYIKVSSPELNNEWTIDEDLKNQAIFWIKTNPIQFLKNTLSRIYIIFFDPRILPIMPWHNNIKTLINISSLTLFFIKFLGWFLFISSFKITKKFFNNFKLLKKFSNQNYKNLFFYYLFFYFLPFIFAKYDVRHFAPIIPIIFLLAVIRYKENVDDNVISNKQIK